MLADFPAPVRRRKNVATPDRGVGLTAKGLAAIGRHASLRAFANPIREAEATFTQLSVSDRAVAAADALLWARDLALSLDLPEAS